jgi:hypothetical protein
VSLIFPATADAIGRLRFDAPELAAVELSRLAGKPLSVMVKRAFANRSDAQNRLLWGHVYAEAVADGIELVELATGEPVFKTRDDVHNFGKVNLLTRPVETNRGLINLLGTTTTLTTAEFSEYIERLCVKLAGFGIYIPPIGG